MGKRKNKNRSSENVMARGRGTSGIKFNDNDKMKENPFELRLNKRRYEILGRKSKHDKGRPGVARSKGIKKVI